MMEKIHRVLEGELDKYFDRMTGHFGRQDKRFEQSKEKNKNNATNV